MDTADSHQPVADSPLPPHLRYTATNNLINDPTTPVDDEARVSTEDEELQVEVLKAKIELEVYKGKLKDIHDAVVVVVKPHTPFRKDAEEMQLTSVDLRTELEICVERIQELESEREDKIRFLEQTASSIDTVKHCLSRMLQTLNDDEVEDTEHVVDGIAVRMTSTLSLTQRVATLVDLASVVERRVSEYHETRKKERKQLESSVVSLTEENRDINTLLRVALVEKENVEKSLNRLKGNSEPKRVPLLQFAERGLHKVGFSFMMASSQTEQLTDSSTVSTASKSDGSDYEEEIVSLASVVEKIMKNLRAEISQLRISLDDARSDNERLQTLSEKQGQIIAENAVYIKQLEDREQRLSHNVEGLLIEMRETEEEVSRWREACELEVKAGKDAVDHRDQTTLILQQELEKTKAALEISNSKLKLKEELANAAMAAQSAAEKSLHLSDSRAAGLRERIEELTRQLEETDRQQSNIHRVRHLCWPWLALKLNPIATTNRRSHDTRRVVPQMQALLPG